MAIKPSPSRPIFMMVCAAFLLCTAFLPGSVHAEANLAPQAQEIVISGSRGFVDPINPLTGLPAPDPAQLNRRPVMVKVSNYPPSVRPQAGLSYADLVFEYYIGMGENRFVATYYSQNAVESGSLRSGRLVDSQLANMYGALLVYGSADARVDEVLQNELGDRAISNLEVPCPIVCGEETHQKPWVYVNSGEISNFAVATGINNTRPNLNGMLFSEATPSSGLFGVQVGVEYSDFDRGEWRYDAASGKYQKWVEMNLDKTLQVPHTDRLNNTQLAFDNVILLMAGYHEYNSTLHDIYLWDVSSNQPAYFFRDGIMIKGSWRSAGHDRPLQFYDARGLPMALKPGTSWIVIAGKSSRLEDKGSGIWDLQFALP